MTERFDGSFTQQEPIPDEGIAAALAVLRHGRLHRYNLAAGEAGEVALLEEEFAAATGARYCLAVASGGYAMATALRAAGVAHGDAVLTNAFTLAPVPGAIASLGARPVFVEITRDLVIDLDDLAGKARASGARVLMLSLMRGHLPDMEALIRRTDALGLTVIEDCAHTMGAAWNGRPSGRFGMAGCYSTQTYKHINSGEGGLIVSDVPDLMAKAVLLSGSYMLYGRHRASPPLEMFEKYKYLMPNISGRMDNLRAAVLRPQLRLLDSQRDRWTRLYRGMEEGLAGTPGLQLVPRPVEETFVGSSFQFLLPDWPATAVSAVVARCLTRGVELKWFGAAEPVAFTSRHAHWRYADPQALPQTDRILAGLLDMRLPLTFDRADVDLIARIIRAEVGSLWQAGWPPAAPSDTPHAVSAGPGG